MLIGCGAFAALFAFISGSPFDDFIEHFGMSPQQMGLAFGLNVTGFMIGVDAVGATRAASARRA